MKPKLFKEAELAIFVRNTYPFRKLKKGPNNV